MSWIRDVLDWDEARDPARARDKPLRVPWHRLNARDRQLLDAISDGSWVQEGALRGFLRWGRLRFLWTTVWLIIFGWIEARPRSSTFRASEFRLNPEVWTRQEAENSPTG